jgi:hypothetical protein
MGDRVKHLLMLFTGLKNETIVSTNSSLHGQSTNTKHPLREPWGVEEPSTLNLQSNAFSLTMFWTNNVLPFIENFNEADKFLAQWLVGLHFSELMSRTGRSLKNVRLTVQLHDDGSAVKEYSIDLHAIFNTLGRVRQIADNLDPNMLEKESADESADESEEPNTSTRLNSPPKIPRRERKRVNYYESGSESEKESDCESELSDDESDCESDLSDDESELGNSDDGHVVEEEEEVDDVVPDDPNTAKDAAQLERERYRERLYRQLCVNISLQNIMRVWSMIVDGSLQLTGVECSSDGTNVAAAAAIARSAYPNDPKPPPTKIEEFLSSSRIGTDNLMRLVFWTLLAEQMEKDEVLAPSARPSMNRWPSCVEWEHRNRKTFDVATVVINGRERIRSTVKNLCGCSECRMFFGPQKQRSGHLYVRVIWTGYHVGFYIHPDHATGTGLTCFIQHLRENLQKHNLQHQLFLKGLTVETLRDKVLRFSSGRTRSVLSPSCTPSQWDDVFHAVVIESLQRLQRRPDDMKTIVVSIEDNTSPHDFELPVKYSMLGQDETRTLHVGHGQPLTQVFTENHLDKLIQVNEYLNSNWLALVSLLVEGPVLDLRPYQINVLKMDDFVPLASEDEFKRELLDKLGLRAPETPRRLTTVNGVAFSSTEDMWKFFFQELIRERCFSMSGLRGVTECVYTECFSKSALHQRCIDQIRRSKLIVPFVRHQFLPKKILRGYLPNGCSWLRKIDMNLIFPCRRSEQDGFMTLGMVLKEFLRTNLEQMPHGTAYGFLKNSLTNRLQPLAEDVVYVHIGEEEPTLSLYGENTWNGEDSIQPTYKVDGEQLSFEEYLPLTRAFETKEAFVLAKSGWSEALELVRTHATFGLRCHLPPIGPSTKSLSEWKGLMLNTENGWRRGGINNHRWQCIRIPLGERPPARKDDEDTFDYTSRIFDQLNRYLWKRVDTESELFDAYVERKEHELNETLVGKSQQKTLGAQVSGSKNKTFKKALYDEYIRRKKARLSVMAPPPLRRRKASSSAKAGSSEDSPPSRKKAKVTPDSNEEYLKKISICSTETEEEGASSSKKRPLAEEDPSPSPKKRRLVIGCTYLYEGKNVRLNRCLDNRVEVLELEPNTDIRQLLSRERFNEKAVACIDLTYD